MRAVIRKDNVTIEFSGRGQLWNDLLRPYVGGPEAPAESLAPPAPPVAPFAAVPAAVAQAPRPQTPVAQPGPSRSENGVPAPTTPRTVIVNHPAQQRPMPPAQPRTWYPPKQQPVPRAVQVEPAPSHYSTEEEDGQEAPRVEPSSDPATLYERLGEMEGRRSERDAVLAAVWFVTKGERETTGDEVESHLASFHAFGDVKVVPHLLKHVHRTKMLEQGSNPKAVRLTKKGFAYVHGRLVGN